MHDTTEHILADLYTIDPSLKERDREVRAIVATLMSNRPEVEIDQTFVHNLRRTILTQAPAAPTPSPWGSWLVHLAPVGVVAILTLMLVPDLMGPQPLPPTINEYARSTEESPAGATERAVEMPAADMGAKRVAQETTDSVSIMSMTGPVDAPINSFALTPQTPGNTMTVETVSVTQPSFLAIERVLPDGNVGEVVGLSTLLPIGVTLGLTVPLTIGTAIDETYYASLYPDNGDGRFTEDDRALLHDSEALSVRTLVSIVAPR